MARATTRNTPKPKATLAQTFRIDSVRASSADFVQRNFRGHSRDHNLLLGLTLLLTAIGLVFVLSSSFVDAIQQNNNVFSIAGKQLLAALLGLVGLSWASSLRTQTIQMLASWLSIGSIAVQLLVVLTPLGVSVNGNKNWIRIFGFTLQPSEFMKVAMILWIALLLQKHSHELDDGMVWAKLGGITALAFFAPVLLGKDVGTTIVMALVAVMMSVFAGLPRLFVYLIGAVGAVAVPAIMASSPSRWGRVMAWLHPDAPDPNDYGWQSTHAIWAFAAGGIGGVGLGQSELKWSWIPEAENDFIFAIIGEEAGLIGAVVLILLFVALSALLIRIALRTPDPVNRMIVLGVMLWISLQAFINIAVVLTWLPVLGVPLPLISSGGSSMISSLFALGLVLAIEKQNGAPLRTSRSRR